MAVQFILGSAGSGKSHKLYEMLTTRAYNDEDMQFVAIVPEQYSMESQKEIVFMHPRHGAFNTEVVSFNRLAFAVFEEMGLETVEVMDDLGKTMVLMRVLEKCKNELKLYGQKISMPGFVDKIKSTISELEQYDISEEELNEMIDSCSERPTLQKKLIDIDTIYREFNKFIDERRLPQEVVLSKLCDYIDKSDKIKNSEYFVDGFTGFTPIQKRVVAMLIKHAHNVTFSFTLPEEETVFTSVKEQELFALSKKSILSIKEACNKQGVSLLPDIIIEKIEVDGQLRPYRCSGCGEISHIEQNIFRYAKTQKYEGECNNVSIHLSGNPRQEARLVASKIIGLMVEGDKSDKDKLRYRDIAVITADMDGYYRYIEEAFLEYNIPAFIDHKRSISSNPYVDSITGLLEVIEKDFSYDSVMHFLRLGVLDLEYDSIDLFDNYILANGITGHKAYQLSWITSQEDISSIGNVVDDCVNEEECEDTDEGIVAEEISNMEKVDQVRKRLFDGIYPYKDGLTNTTVKEKIETLYRFVVDNKFETKISSLAEQFEEQGNKAKKLEYTQTYKEIINLFNKVGEFLGEEKLSRKDFKNVLESGINSIKVGIIPPDIDSVMVGDIERTRLKDIKKVVFVIGANDGYIPKNTSGSGIISDVERDFLVENDFTLAPTARENAFTQKLYLYTTLTKASKRLFITYSKSNTAGEEQRPSYIIATIKKMFPTLKIVDEELKEESAEQIVSKQDAYRFIARALNNYRLGKQDSESNQVLSILASNEEYREILLSMIDAAFYRRDVEKLSPELAKDLYGRDNTIGITRLERFAACAYAQFINNGLKLNQRQQYTFAAYDLGNVYHYAIDYFFRQVSKYDLNWADISEQQRKSMVDVAVEDSLGKLNISILNGSARNAYIKRRVREVTERTVEVLGQHLIGSEFVPAYYEFPVEHGRVDRVDEFQKDNRLYIKVIDYKSGKKRFNLCDTFFGLQMQLIVYLKDTIEKEKKKYPDKTVLPGGAFYYHIGNPIITKPDFESELARYMEKEEYKDMSKEDIKLLIAKRYQYEEFKMSGIVNSNDEVIDAIDPLAKEFGSSAIIPIKYTKKGDVGKTYMDKVLSPEGLDCLMEYVDYKVDYLKDRIYEGEISPNPQLDGCRYCVYKGICGFDTALGDEYRVLPKLDSNVIMGYMKDKKEYMVTYSSEDEEDEEQQ